MWKTWVIDWGVYTYISHFLRKYPNHQAISCSGSVTLPPFPPVETAQACKDVHFTLNVIQWKFNILLFFLVGWLSFSCHGAKFSFQLAHQNRLMIRTLSWNLKYADLNSSAPLTCCQKGRHHLLLPPTLNKGSHNYTALYRANSCRCVLGVLSEYN